MRKLSHILTALLCLGIATAWAANSITVDKATIGALVYNSSAPPAPSASVRGGIKSLSASSHNFLTGLGTDGALTRAQPAASDISGLAASATTDTTDAGNISSGTLSLSRLALTDSQLYIGSSGNVPAAVPLSGDCSIANTGAITCTKTGGTSFATVATSGSASDLGSGTLAAARGGAGTITGALKGNGAGVVSQAACADLSNAAASCSTDTTVASNISSGTLPAARLPNPSSSTLGGVESYAAVSNQFVTSISTSGVPASAQPSCSTLSNAASSCSTDTTSASNISSGTLSSSRLPSLTNHGLVVGTGSAGAPTLVGPDSSTTKVLTAAGSSGDPAFATAPGVLRISNFTTGTSITYTPTSGTTALWVCVTGGGGAGGGAASTSSSQLSFGAAAAGGATACKYISSSLTTLVYSVGAGGTPGSAGNVAGGNGGNSTFGGDFGTTLTGTAGNGGAGGGAGTATGGPYFNAGTAGAAATGGDINITGGSGPICMSSITNITLVSFGGGVSRYSTGGAQQQLGASGAAGTAAAGYGGGGGPAINAQSQSARAGGAGSAGLVQVWDLRS